jgi:dipeptidyl aminopeptidase/acylaminoacyl peptidase
MRLVTVDRRGGRVLRKLADGYGRRIAFLAQTVTSPTDVWVVDVGGAARRLTNLNPHIGGWRLGAVREVTWRNSRDGLLVHGVLITPPDYVPGRRYPTVVQCHQGDLRGTSDGMGAGGPGDTCWRRTAMLFSCRTTAR